MSPWILTKHYEHVTTMLSMLVHNLTLQRFIIVFSNDFFNDHFKFLHVCSSNSKQRTERKEFWLVSERIQKGLTTLVAEVFKV